MTFQAEGWGENEQTRLAVKAGTSRCSYKAKEEDKVEQKRPN